MSIYRGQGGAPSATDSISLNQIIQLETDAGISASVAEASATAASASASAASISESNSASSALLTAADALATAADVVLTHADVVLTHADVVLTNADVATTAANLLATGLDADATAEDAIATAADVLLTNADVVTTNADVVLTHADVLLTAADALATASDASTASTAASNAATSASNASTSESNALASAEAAAASALTIPSFDSLAGQSINYPRVNAGETGIEFRTPAQVLADIGAEAANADILKANASDNLSVGFTTDIETLVSNTITPDLTTEWLKYRAVTGTVTINEPADGAYGGCVILLNITGAGTYTVTLGAGCYPVGTIPDLLTTIKYECRVVKHTALITSVEIVEVVGA